MRSKRPRQGLLWGLLVAAIASISHVAANHARYFQYERRNDFRILHPTPTTGGEFVEIGDGRLGLDSRIASRIEARLSPQEFAALRAEGRAVLWRIDEPHGWLHRVFSVELIKDAHPFEIGLRLHLADPALADRVARLAADEVLQFGAFLELERAHADMRQKFKEAESRGETVPIEQIRAANMKPGLSITHVHLLKPAYLQANDGKVVVWSRLWDVIARAALWATALGILTTCLVFKVGAKRPALSP